MTKAKGPVQTSGGIRLPPETDYVPIDSVKPFPGNARKNEKAVPGIMVSMRQFGWTNPMLAQRSTRYIVAGKTRFLAAQRLGIKVVPVIFLDLSDYDADLYNLADNRLGDVAGYSPTEFRAQVERLKREDLPIAGVSEEEAESVKADLEVEEIDTSTVGDRFWVSITGPLPKQPDVLEKLKSSIKVIAGVEVEIGTSKEF